MTSVDPPAASGQLDFVGALLVADTRAFVAEWRQWIAAQTTPLARDAAGTDDLLVELRERSQTLQLRARAVGVGGLAHHLGLGEQCLQRECDRERLQGCLTNILELAWQLEQELELPGTSAPALLAVDSETVDSSVEERPSISPIAAQPVGGPPPALVGSPWRGWKRMPLAAQPSPEARVDVASDAAAALSQVLGLTPIGAAAPSSPPPAPSPPLAAASSPAAAPSPPPAAPSPPPAAPAPPRIASKSPTGAPSPPRPAPRLPPVASSAPTVAPSSPTLEPSAPTLEPSAPAVASTAPAEPSAPAVVSTAHAETSAPPAASTAPAETGAPPVASTAPVETSVSPEEPSAPPVAALAALPVLPSAGAAAATAAPPLLSDPVAAAAAPPLLISDPPAGTPAPEAAAELLPAEFVVDAEDEDDELTDQDLEIRLELSRRTSPMPLLLAQHEVAIELPQRGVPFLRKARRASRRTRWVGLLALGVAGGLLLLALVLTRSVARDVEARADNASVTTGALLPHQRAIGSEKGLYVLLAQAHVYGNEESPQLGQLIDDEAAAIAKAMTEPCAPGSLVCRLSEQGQLLLEGKPFEPKPLPANAIEHPGPSEPPVDWLAGLQPPRIGVPLDARIQKQLAFHTEDAVGREIFQDLLFQCAASAQLFSGALRERNLPPELAAVVMVESRCAPDPESALGARGLWQFTRARARAYHLRVQAGVIDERLNATKATEAALDLLHDLYVKLGSWQLAIASYQLGPFHVLARSHQVGSNTDYAALVAAGQLPPDTLDYVAKVEAFALILTNLDRFRFSAPPDALSSSSTALRVPAGTRIGLVARAVSSSAGKIRELNPELIADIVPGAAGEEFSLQVPGSAGPSSRDQLDRLIARADGADECVPLSFDWGRQQLTRAMLSRCKR